MWGINHGIYMNWGKPLQGQGDYTAKLGITILGTYNFSCPFFWCYMSISSSENVSWIFFFQICSWSIQVKLWLLKMKLWWLTASCCQIRHLTWVYKRKSSYNLESCMVLPIVYVVFLEASLPIALVLLPIFPFPPLISTFVLAVWASNVTLVTWYLRSFSFCLRECYNYGI